MDLGQLFRRIFPHAKWKCLECNAFQETRLLKPKGWVKVKTKDGNTLVFCSQKCKEEWFGENTRTAVAWPHNLEACMPKLTVQTAESTLLRRCDNIYS